MPFKVARKYSLRLATWMAVLFGGVPGGAADDDTGHWAYRPPVRPAVPWRLDDRWSQTPIDAFVADAQRRDGLTPAALPPLPRQLRRAALALTGLPPGVEELTRFKAGEPASHAPDAFERHLDRLLASPRYGERMAVWWLDLARYADTHGYHVDSHRDMWRWRDWVIAAFNRGLPFDQFTIEQLAGDQLPSATLDQQIASGFNRNNMINFENGAIAEEYLAEYAADRLITTSTVWLAQTMQCARCHDHKHDPFTQTDFYRLIALFNQLPEKGLDGERGNAPPWIPAPTHLQQEELEKLQRRIRILEDVLDQREESRDAEQIAWEQENSGGDSARRNAIPRDTQWRLSLDDDSIAIVTPTDRHDAQPVGTLERIAGREEPALLLNGENGLLVPGLPDLPNDGPTTICFTFLPTTADDGCLLARWVEEPTPRGWEIAFLEGRLAVRLFHDGASGVDVRSEKLPLRRWQQVTIQIDGRGRADGIRLFVNGSVQPSLIRQDNLTGAYEASVPLRIGAGSPGTGTSAPGVRGLLRSVQVFTRALSDGEVALLSGNDPVQQLLAISPAQRTADQRRNLRRYYLEAQDAEYRRIQQELKGLLAVRDELVRSFPTTMVMQDDANPRATRVLNGGRYDSPVGPPLEAALPDILSEGTRREPLTRLAFARWLTSDANPLTARVVVNRIWQLHFGLGLVRTSEDFGMRGALPTHPELLDWLALEFTRVGWDLKRLQRTILLSSTYRQENHAARTAWERDPENRDLTRGPRLKLDAEFIRDRALYAAGILGDAIGGPSVRPYQPPGLWEEVSYDPDKYTAQVFRQDHGASLYRRGLYTFWKRSVPPPALSVFDAPEREVCTVRRSRTNSPLQALALQNDPTFVEAARLFAERILAEGGASDLKRIEFGFSAALGREPLDAERERIHASLSRQRFAFRAQRENAMRLLAVGEYPRQPNWDPAELAAWTMIAQSLFCLDEFLTNE